MASGQLPVMQVILNVAAANGTKQVQHTRNHHPKTRFFPFNLEDNLL